MAQKGAQLNIRVEPGVLQALKNIAHRRGDTVTTIVLEALIDIYPGVKAATKSKR